MRPIPPDAAWNLSRSPSSNTKHPLLEAAGGKGSSPGGHLLGIGSVAWEIHRERTLLLGWGRAILLQFAHPLVAAGVADHSTFRAASWGRLRRLHRTLEAMLHLTFGSAGEVERVAPRLRARHAQVQGRLEMSVGIFPAGTPYAADDPALLRWVHSTVVDSHLRTYALFVGALPAEAQDRYCAEVARLGRFLGIPEGFLPTNVTALHEYLGAMLTSGEIVVTDMARALAREILYPPTFGVAVPPVWLLRLATIGLLPPTIRDAYGLSWEAKHETALRRSAQMFRTLLPWAPASFRYWPHARAAARAEAA